MSRDLRKFFVLLTLTAAAAPLAGAYGALHDQLSYTVSPEYFTLFKFPMFGLAGSALPPRLLASWVGFLATWWMGVLVGALVGAAGWLHAQPRRMARVSLEALLVALAVAFSAGLLGLLYGFLRTTHIRAEDYAGWYVPNHVHHLRRFLCVGYMHDASYLGAAPAVLAAWGYQWRRRARA